jgi:hypothetical protein
MVDVFHESGGSRKSQNLFVAEKQMPRNRKLEEQRSALRNGFLQNEKVINITTSPTHQDRVSNSCVGLHKSKEDGKSTSSLSTKLPDDQCGSGSVVCISVEINRRSIEVPRFQSPYRTNSRYLEFRRKAFCENKKEFSVSHKFSDRLLVKDVDKSHVTIPLTWFSFSFVMNFVLIMATLLHGLTTTPIRNA